MGRYRRHFGYAKDSSKGNRTYKQAVKGSEYLICESCGNRQMLLRTKHQRRSTVHCDECGGYLLETKTKQETRQNRSVSPRYCQGCETKLNSYNPTFLCSTCAKAVASQAEEKG